MDCSVVVATYNRVEGLLRLLDALGRQDIPSESFEVVVTDDGSSDGTWQRLAEVRSPYRLRRIRQDNRGPAAARNAAIRLAEGTVIVTLDDDVEPAPDLLRRHLEAQEREGGVAAIGRMIYPEDGRASPWVRWEQSGLEGQYESMLLGRWAPTPRQFYTANTSVPRSIYEKAGLFDTRYRRAEDVEIAYRFMDLGVRFRFLPEAVIHHRPRRSFAAWKRMAWQYGYYDVTMSREGRLYIFELMGHELLTQRSAALRPLARLLLPRRRVLEAFTSLAGWGARLAQASRMHGPAMDACGAIFGLLYLRGAAEAYGDQRSFLSDVEAAAQPVDLEAIALRARRGVLVET
jgi:GT2 family glycosyltransferase